MGVGIFREFGMDIHTAIRRMDNQKVLLHSTGNSAQCYGVASMGGSFEDDGYMRMCGWSPSAVHRKLSQTLLIGTFQYKMKT